MECNLSPSYDCAKATNLSNNDTNCLDSTQIIDQATVHPVDDVEARYLPPEQEDFQDATDHDDNSVPFAVASALAEPLLSPASLYFVQCDPAQPVREQPSRSSTCTPEFVYANVIKPSPKTTAGVAFTKLDGVNVITKIHSNGLFGGTGLRSGDRLVAVNGMNCMDAPLKRVAQMIREAESTLNICVWRKEGEPGLMKTSIQKPTNKSKLGISFQMRNDALTVSRVEVDGLFAGSLLMPDHRCFMINDQPCHAMNAYDAAALTAKSSRVTIVSRARGDLASVVAVGENERRRWSAVAMGAATAAVALTAFGSLS